MLDAKTLGLKSIGTIHHNLGFDELFEHETRNDEGRIASNGTMMIDTGKFTGRSPKDKYFVHQLPSSNHIAWGRINQPVAPEVFDELFAEVTDYLSGKDLYVTDGFCGANEKTRRPVRFVTEFAWQSHFVKNMFIRPEADELKGFKPTFTVYNASNLKNEKWEKHGLNSEVFIIFNIEKNVAIIGGTWYGGEMKKGIFTMMNFWLPLDGILSMHCSANVGTGGDVCLFVGLSGTGVLSGLVADFDQDGDEDIVQADVGTGSEYFLESWDTTVCPNPPCAAGADDPANDWVRVRLSGHAHDAFLTDRTTASDLIGTRIV